jgi:GGDEF domain-containing protein
LQPQVDQLAEVLSLELAENRDYVQVLLEAHRQMAALSEDLSAGASDESADDVMHAQLLAQARELTVAMQEFLARGQQIEHDVQSSRQWNAGHAPHDPAEVIPTSVTHIGRSTGSTGLMRNLKTAISRCRERRRALSLLLAEPNVYDVHSDPSARQAGRQVRMALRRSCESLDTSNVTVLSLENERTAVILADCERHTAVALAHSIVDSLGETLASGNSCNGLDTTLSIGVATASVVPKNFDPLRLIDSAAGSKEPGARSREHGASILTPCSPLPAPG